MKEYKADPNKIIASLKNQIATQSVLIAERESLIEEMGRENIELQKEIDQLRKEQIEEMDSSFVDTVSNEGDGTDTITTGTISADK